MGKSGDQSTDEFLAIRFPHLRKTWLDEINDAIGWLKQNFKGNATMQIPWNGGIPGEVHWFVKVTQGRPKNRMV